MTEWQIYWAIVGPLAAVFVATKAMGFVAPFLERRSGSSNPVVKAASAAYWPLHEAWTWAQIHEAYRRAGHDNPTLATETEIFERGEVLERFRDDASAAYLKDKTPLAEFCNAFIKERLMAKTTILSTDRTAALRAVLRDMGPSEAYHPDALKQYEADQATSDAAILKEAEIAFGPGGYSPLQRRVLRGRA